MAGKDWVKEYQLGCSSSVECSCSTDKVQCLIKNNFTYELSYKSNRATLGFIVS